MKKIYIHTDLEGVSGIDKAEMIERDYPNYSYVIERLMADTNAAIDGAFLGGADHVTVLDSHGGGGNFNLNLIDKRAEVDTKPNKRWWGILDDSYFGSFFIGAHSMAGTINGFYDHTQGHLPIYNCMVNGRRVGELAQWAMVCAHHDVPVIMVSGDESAANEALQFFGGIETAVVKKGLSWTTARLIPLDEATERIRQAAKTAVEKIEKARPFKPTLPMELRFEFTRTEYCDDAIRDIPSLERIDARAVRRISNSYQDFWLCEV